MFGRSGRWWLGTVLHQVSRSPGTSAAVLFLVLDDGTEVITFPRLNWAVVAIVLLAILGAGVALMILISAADFDDAPTPGPAPPATCDMFCPAP
ncbi:DUF3104 domain-containing protein [Nocardia huaxiensis]|uniref:Uncharacterized protein n=1 Tax=Nocardia huaxiensis TaxID=2755382 RepID=A0A7D6ZBG7_9NOCA|nr:DUF3104 domain-containing protein [Nocardia huaxiensis]QLY29658.1 hypothetical protein H0264_31180 [Nocardia huaxiensis]UFS96768.1 DUF3104 domain-containing protein [Nocardia huaxiensis]